MEERGKPQSTIYGVGPPSSLPPVTRSSSPSIEAPDLAPGTRIAQYELIRELGRGGMGVVYAARDLKLGRRVAMKFLRRVDPEVLDRFLIEARATAQCNHENIVIIYAVDEYRGMPYMVLEYLEGRSLREFMGPFGNGEPMPPTRVVELVLPIARALARAAELGIVHRDLKPENVLVTAGHVKVLDFGIAKALGTGTALRPRRSQHELMDMTVTAEGAMVGTLPYMSPEHMGVDDLDGRSDLYSLGVIMFEMLSGKHPVEPLGSEAVTESLISPEPLRSIRSVLPDLSEALARIVDQCLNKVKEQRIASARELVERLEAAMPQRGGRKLVDGESPFPGLTSFQEADAERFFGRSREVARMVARVRDLPLTGIVGPSGVGKSSFVRAGVGPALKASGENWDVISLRPGRNPLAALATIVERFTTTGGRSSGEPVDHERLVARLRTEPGYLGSLLRSRASATRMNVLLFVDQFEELYTLVGDAEERRAFTTALAAIGDDTAAPLRVIVSMRSDFVDRLGEDPRFLDELSRGLVFLSTPDDAGLREALVQPLELVGYRFESPAMLDEMLAALEGTPGALALLQFAAAKLWDARDRERHMLTLESYRAIGGVSGALAAHADEVVRNQSASEQLLTRNIFRQLVTPERTRGIVELSDLHALGADVPRVLDLLVRSRLLVVQTRGDSAGGTVEVVHESLIERWPMLRRWLDEDHDDAAILQDVVTAAKQWDAKGRPQGLLWSGEAMDEAHRWYTSRPRQLGTRERAFLEAGIALARRGKRRRRALQVVAFVVLGGVAVGSSVAYVRVRDAERKAIDQATVAASEARRATDALDKVVAEQQRREAAERDARAAAAAEQAAKQAEREKAVDLQMTREQLIDRNKELETSIADAKAARDRAEAASKAAAAAAATEKQLQVQLQQKLEAEKARVKQLEQELKKVSTQLKD